MAEEVGGGDGYEHSHEPGCDVAGLQAAAVELDGEEADADVQGFPGNFVFVDQVAVVPVKGDETER